MATISSPGVGSGLDVVGLVNRLVSAEARPVSVRLARQEGNLQAELSSYGTLKGALSAFQSSLTSLKDLATFQARSVTVGDSDVLSASASSSAAASAYNINVTQLADSHSLVSTAFASSLDVVGTGTLTFNFGTTVYDQGSDSYTSFTPNPDKSAQSVTIDSTNNTLEGIRDAVNGADIGVNASIVNDGSGERLVFVSTDSGQDNSLEVTVDEGGFPADNLDTSGLSQLAFNSGATNLEQTVAAQDAQFTVNGLAITSSSNTVSDSLEGVTLNLLATGSSTLNVEVDSGKVSSAINHFVTEYNKLVDTINDLSKYDPETREAGVLLGDAALRTINAQLRRSISSPVSGLTGAVDSLASIGITTDSLSGKLTIDDSVFSDALKDNLNGVAALFADKGTTSDPLIRYVSATEHTVPGTYDIVVTQDQALIPATSGFYTGGATAGFAITINNGNRRLDITVDGVASNNLRLTRTTYNTGNDLAAEIESQINSNGPIASAGKSVSVIFDTDHFVITSNSTGITSTVEITGGSSLTDLGFTAGAGTPGADEIPETVFGGTIGGQVTTADTSDGEFLTGTGSVSGLTIEVRGGGNGNRGTVTFTQGLASTLDNLLSGMLEGDGLIEARTEGINTSLSQIAEDRETLERRLEALEARYLRQFTALDILISQLQSSSDFLAQQLASLPGARSTGG